MCGIFGLVLLENGSLYQLIINGLIQLQNRGYDSAGLCTIHQDKLEVIYKNVREVLEINNLYQY